jgi:hypothetical protein
MCAIIQNANRLSFRSICKLKALSSIKKLVLQHYFLSGARNTTFFFKVTKNITYETHTN